MPIDAITALAGSVASDQNLRDRLPKFGRELAGGFTAQLAEPPSQPRDPQRIRIVKIAVTRVEVIGETVVELAEPVEVFT